MRQIVATGQKFNRLTALHKDPSNPKKWFYECECGVVASRRSADVTRGHVKSCGCFNMEARRSRIKHGATRDGAYHPLWDMYCGMIARCENPNHVAYHNYGGKGIKVCARWKHFSNFVQDMGERPVGMSIDRVDVLGDYESGNCRWATSAEQSLNTSRNVRITLNGKELTVSQWATELGMRQATLNKRRYLGWTDEEVLTIPKGGKRAGWSA